MKKSKLLLLTVILIVSTIVLIIFFSGKPAIPKDSIGHATVEDVVIYTSDKHLVIEKSDYNEEALLQYLSSCKVRLCALNPSHLNSSQGTLIYILIRYNGKPISIYIADKIRVNYGGWFDYTVKQPTVFSDAIFQILDPNGIYGLN